MTARLLALCALLTIFCPTSAAAQLGLLPKVNFLAGTAPLEVERFRDGASTGTGSETDFALGVQASLGLPTTGIVAGVRYLRTIGSVKTQGNSANAVFEWGFGANEVGGFLEYQRNLAPASPASVSLGFGGSVSRLSVDDDVTLDGNSLADIEGDTTVVRLYAVGEASVAGRLNLRVMAGAVVSGKIEPPDLQTPDITFTTENDEVITYSSDYTGPFLMIAVGFGLI